MSEASPLRDIGEHRVRLTEQEAQCNLRAVLELCAAGELRCSEKTSRPSAATVRTVEEHLAHRDFYCDDPIASFSWPLLIQAGGLAKIENGRLQLTSKGRSALQKPPAEVIRQLWQRWLTHAVIDEFSRIEQIKGQRVRNVLTAAKTRRQTVATAVARCPPEEWIGVDALFTTMRRGNIQLLKVLSTLDVVATGILSPADQLVLSAYAEHTADRVWTISAASLLAAINTGRDPQDFATFLAQRSEHELPGSLRTLIGDVTRRATQLTDLGHARVIECADPALATLLTRDRALRHLCRPLSDRHLAIPLDQELTFRQALLKLGYVLPGQRRP
jgi:hypothetical protein